MDNKMTMCILIVGAVVAGAVLYKTGMLAKIPVIGGLLA